MVRPPAEGYDADVAGLDEARARVALADMQDRLARGPIAALGIAASSTPEDVRAAFLQLTKQYHPVRFVRMAIDIQKLANEVFLALRAAHDTAARSLHRPSNPIAAPPIPPGTAGPPPTAPLAAPVPGRAGQGLPLKAAAPTRAAAVTARDEAAVLDLLQRQQWDLARNALHQLSARDPGSKRIRALVCYARGREAQLDRRLDDARVELQEALALDPALQPAKTALTELFTRRK
jgi:hypothetical protein